MLVTPNTECRVDYNHGLDSSDEDIQDTPSVDLSNNTDNNADNNNPTLRVPDSASIFDDPDSNDSNELAKEFPVINNFNDTLPSSVHEEFTEASDLDATIPYAMHSQDVEARPRRQRKKPSYLADYDTSGGRKKNE